MYSSGYIKTLMKSPISSNGSSNVGWQKFRLIQFFNHKTCNRIENCKTYEKSC